MYMKKIFKISAVFAAICLVTLAGCSKQELSTDQYADDAVALNVYGPQPVVRGGVLRFLGSNLDRVVSVVLPGVDPITDIEVVQAGVPSEIRITVPKDGPEPGLVTLVTDDGQEIVTKTELTYSEPIEFEDFTPKSAKAGDVITITGDYLNLIKEVVFSENVLVSEDDFISHTRYEIKVTVPAEAQTGEIGLGDADELKNPDVMANIVMSEDELVLSQPTVTGMSPLAVRPGDNVKIAGTQMTQIVEVRFEGAVPVPAEDFVNVTDTEITVPVPADAHDGPAVCVSAAGTEAVTEESIVLAVPQVSKVSAQTRFKAGLAVVIEGRDLDLVTGVSFSTAAAAEFTYADGSITATIPATAVNGAITLSTAAGKTVSTEAVTLVVPQISAFSPAKVNAGEEFTINGTDLDLVTGVSLSGEACEFSLAEGSTTEITVSTVATSKSGKVTLTLANGVSVESTEDMVVEALTVVQVTELSSPVKAGENATMKGSNFNMIESITIGGYKVVSYVNRSDSEMVFTVPAEVNPGEYAPHFVLTTGAEEDCLYTLTVEGAETTIWEGPVVMTWSAGGRVVIPAAPFETCPAGAKINFYFTQTPDSWSQIQFNYADWTELVFPEIGKRVFEPTADPAGWGWTFGSRCLTLTLTQEIIDNILAKRQDCTDEGVTDAGMILQGDGGNTFTKVTILK